MGVARDRGGAPPAGAGGLLWGAERGAGDAVASAAPLFGIAVPAPGRLRAHLQARRAADEGVGSDADGQGRRPRRLGFPHLGEHLPVERDGAAEAGRRPHRRAAPRARLAPGDGAGAAVRPAAALHRAPRHLRPGAVHRRRAISAKHRGRPPRAPRDAVLLPVQRHRRRGHQLPLCGAARSPHIGPLKSGRLLGLHAGTVRGQGDHCAPDRGQLHPLLLAARKWRGRLHLGACRRPGAPPHPADARPQLHSACPVLDGTKWAANKWLWNVPRNYLG